MSASQAKSTGTQKVFVLPASTMQELIKYLAARPYAEVSALVDGLRTLQVAEFTPTAPAAAKDVEDATPAQAEEATPASGAV